MATGTGTMFTQLSKAGGRLTEREFERKTRTCTTTVPWHVNLPIVMERIALSMDREPGTIVGDIKRNS